MLVHLVLATLLSRASGQAPGDHEERCRTGINAPRHHFPMEWRVLMDTYDYGNLLGSRGVWTSTSWLQVVGGSCSWQLTASSCGQTQSQNNWVFSQHISFEDANEIFFNVSVRIDECNNEPNCRDYVTLYRYYSDRMVSNAERINTNNYQPLNGTVEQSRLQRTSEQTLTLTRPADQNGFYLAVRDEGACGQFVRMIVYYVVCKSRVVGLVTYPQTAVPVRNSRDIVFDAMCAANAHNTTSLQVVASSSTSTCSDRAPGGAVCKCNGGYVVSSNGMSCQGCGAGNYRSLSDTSCQPCPGNTVTDVVGAAECRCLEGFYRNNSPQEGPEVACTAPPSECRNIRVISRTSTAITVSWTQPTTTGRPDFFYRVQHSDPNNVGQFIRVNDNLRDRGNEVTYAVSELVPFTNYIVRVSTHNGVSDQDPDSHLRQCQVTSMTREGLPGLPNNLQRLCAVIVWNEPSEPNGNIIRYEIQFSPGQKRSVGPQSTFYITRSEERLPNTEVQVRVVNGAGPGQWTSLQNLGCSTAPGGGTCTTPSPVVATLLHFELGGRTYLNNTVVIGEDIGEGAAGLLCVTNKTSCCTGVNRAGEFYYPNGTMVPNSLIGYNLYRNRDVSIVRLNRRSGTQFPVGEYRCQVPDASGSNQNIYINIVSSSATTCPTAPTTTCPTCPPPTVCPTCPTVTCPPTLPPTTCPPCQPCTTPTRIPTTQSLATMCPECPIATCPTSRPTTTTRLHFELGGRTYLNNTVVIGDDIGEGTAGLLCVTNKTSCCTGVNRAGEFYYPNGTMVPTLSMGYGFYRNRDSSVVRLNRRNGAQVHAGEYRCQVPDAGGVDQSLYINIVSTGVSAPTCPSTVTAPPTVACTPCPSPPIVSCSTCPTPPPPRSCPPCEQCPTTLPPPPSTTTQCMCPATPTCSSPTAPRNDVHFELGGRTYLNNTVVIGEDIGEGAAGLLCVTNKTSCCTGVNRAGEFYYPNGTIVPNSMTGYNLYRNRDEKLVRLNRRSGAQFTVGEYRCQVPDASGVDQSLYINIVSSACSCPTCPSPGECPTTCPTCPTTAACPTTPPPMTCRTCPTTTTTCPTTPPSSPPSQIRVIGIIECEESFVIAISHPVSTTITFILIEIGDEEASETQIEVTITRKSLLVRIPKEKFRSNKLIRGNLYSLHVQGFVQNDPYSFRYSEEIASTALPTPTISSSNLGLYIGITAVLSIILTAIVAGIILACVIYRLRKKKNNPTVATLSSSSYVVKQELESNFGVKNEMTENNNHA